MKKVLPEWFCEARKIATSDKSLRRQLDLLDGHKGKMRLLINSGSSDAAYWEARYAARHVRLIESRMRRDGTETDVMALGPAGPKSKVDVRINHVPSEEVDEIRRIAESNGRSMSEQLRRILRIGLEIERRLATKRSVKEQVRASA